ncbi:15762_t:CDS:1 [Funneliformis mosseae]|uniref:15762_t:CDS:1 n=1 Tax=Funneliformis mosseae TaxID=27381 RepID=A0A9N9FJ51_FUNMO|nr:15762_t:CDS:1 [Funneliformis mosseae]
MLNESNENDKLSSRNDTKSVRQEKFKRFLGVGLMISFEIVLPLILYYILRKYIPEIWALIISGVPPFSAVIFGIIRNRRVDVLGLLIILTTIVGAILAIVKNDARIHLLRETTITGTVGLTFLVTLIPIKVGSFRMRPLTFYFGRDMDTGGSFGHLSSGSTLTGLTEDEPIPERWDRYWNSYSLFRRGFIVLTAVWGLGLLAEVPIRVFIVLKSTSTEKAFLLSNIITYTWLGLLILFNIVYTKIWKKQGQRAEAAAAAAAVATQTPDI